MDKELQQKMLMNEYKHKIDTLRNMYSEEEIELSKTEDNAYRQAVNAMIAERDAKIAELAA